MPVGCKGQATARPSPSVDSSRRMAQDPPCKDARRREHWNRCVLFESASNELQIRMPLVPSDTAAIPKSRMERVGQTTAPFCYPGAGHHCHESVGKRYAPGVSHPLVGAGPSLTFPELSGMFVVIYN